MGNGTGRQDTMIGQGITRVVVKLEAIGDDAHQYKKLIRRGDIDPDFRRQLTPREHLRSQPWIARLTGLDQQFKFKREFVRGQKDYSQANSVGSRGVYIYYALTSGIYEVNAPLSWSRTDRYFCRVKDGQIIRMTFEETLEWLQQNAI